MAGREQLIDGPITRLHESVDGNTSPLSQKSKATGTDPFLYMALLKVCLLYTSPSPRDSV